MIRINLLTIVLSLLYISSIQAKGKHTSEGERTFKNHDVIFNQQSISNNTLLYSTCNFNRANNRQSMDCTVTLEYLNVGVDGEKLSCPVSYHTTKNRELGSDFQLKRLFGNKTIFMWTDVEHFDDYASHRGKGKAAQKIIYYVIDMKACKDYLRDEIVMKRKPRVNEVHVVPYDDTFDIFYPDYDKCGEKMCVQTNDRYGLRRLSGPVPSDILSWNVRDDTTVCPRAIESPDSGHRLVSYRDIYSITPKNVKNLKNVESLPAYPAGASLDRAYKCDRDLLASCWVAESDKSIVECDQYDAQDSTVQFRATESHSKPSSLIAIKNLGPGDILLLTSDCMDKTSCANNSEKVEYNIHRYSGGQSSNINKVLSFSGLHCKDMNNVMGDIYRKGDGDVCVTLTCHTVEKETKEFVINYKTVCVEIA